VNDAHTPARATVAAHAWRRLHAGDLIAEVVMVRGMGLWHVAAYRVGDDGKDVTSSGRSFTLLTEAHAAADELVRSHFDHVCETGVCGRWLRWREDPAE